MGRGKKWSKNEQITLSSAYVACSMDGFEGHDMVFWEQMQVKASIQRPPKALKSKLEEMNRCCFKYHCIDQRIRQNGVTGWTEDDYHNAVNAEYEAREGSRFEFDEELILLKELPKYKNPETMNTTFESPPSRKVVKRKTKAKASNSQHMKLEKNKTLQKFVDSRTRMQLVKLMSNGPERTKWIQSMMKEVKNGGVDADASFGALSGLGSEHTTLSVNGMGNAENNPLFYRLCKFVGTSTVDATERNYGLLYLNPPHGVKVSHQFAPDGQSIVITYTQDSIFWEELMPGFYPKPSTMREAFRDPLVKSLQAAFPNEPSSKSFVVNLGCPISAVTDVKPEVMQASDPEKQNAWKYHCIPFILHETPQDLTVQNQ